MGKDNKIVHFICLRISTCMILFMLPLRIYGSGLSKTVPFMLNQVPAMDTPALRPWIFVSHALLFTVLAALLLNLYFSWRKTKKLNEKMVRFIKAVYNIQKPLELVKGPLMELSRDESLNEVQKSKIQVALWSTESVQETINTLIEQENDDKFFEAIVNSKAGKKDRLKEILDSSKQKRFFSDAFKSDILPGKESQSDLLFMEKLISILKANLENINFTVDTLSQDIGMSRSSLYHRIKDITGLAPADFIRLYRLERAKEMLASKQYGVSEVAYKTGFSDPKYFRLVFKKQYGIPPGSYSEFE